MKNSIWKSDSFRRTGLRHQDKSQPCQDYVLTAQLGKSGNDFFYLGDGVSSCARADYGSKETGEGTRDFFIRKAAEQGYVNRLLTSPKTELNLLKTELIKDIQHRLADYPDADTTLTFVWLINSRYALAGCIGDSAVCIFSENKSLVLTQVNDYGGATESVRNSRAAELIDLRLIDMKVDKVNGFLLTSDGLESVLYTKGKRTRTLHLCQDCVNTLFEEDGHNQIERFLDEVCADGSFDDDISLVIIAREPITLPDDPTWMCTCGTHNQLLSTRCEKCGKDYFSLYGKVDMTGYPTAWEYFKYLNNHPEEEVMAITSKKKPDTKLPDGEHVIYHDDIDSCSDDDYDVVGFVEYQGHRPNHSSDNRKAHNDNVIGNSEKQRRAVSTNKHSANNRSKTALMLPKHIAIIGSAVAALLCGILVVNFFQMLSISNFLREMRAEIDSLKEEKTALITADPTTASSVPETTAVILSTDNETTAVPTQPVTEQNAEPQLSVDEVVSLYPEHNYQHDALDYLTPESTVVEISRESINGVDWVQVKTATGIIGWAPYEYFSPIDESDDQTWATDASEQSD